MISNFVLVLFSSVDFVKSIGIEVEVLYHTAAALMNIYLHTNE